MIPAPKFILVDYACKPYLRPEEVRQFYPDHIALIFESTEEAAQAKKNFNEHFSPAYSTPDPRPSAGNSYPPESMFSPMAEGTNVLYITWHVPNIYLPELVRPLRTPKQIFINLLESLSQFTLPKTIRIHYHTPGLLTQEKTSIEVSTAEFRAAAFCFAEFLYSRPLIKSEYKRFDAEVSRSRTCDFQSVDEMRKLLARFDMYLETIDMLFRNLDNPSTGGPMMSLAEITEINNDLIELRFDIKKQCAGIEHQILHIQRNVAMLEHQKRDAMRTLTSLAPGIRFVFGESGAGGAPSQGVSYSGSNANTP